MLRKPNRLRHFDYSSNGAYFITICIQSKKNILWNVGARIARLSEPLPLTDYGYIAEKSIQNIDRIYPFVHIDKYVIMPNHIHMIIKIIKPPENEILSEQKLRTPTISTIVNQMKGFVSKQIGFSIWQKLFHDHIIRNEDEYRQIWNYIDTNPLKWHEDCFYND